jgi:phospholipase/lecithinase/hemolysin
VTSSVAACVFATNESTGVTGDCTWTTAPAKKDSFLWADELHPSEQADRQLAQQIYGILAGKSTRWVTFYHG